MDSIIEKNRLNLWLLARSCSVVVARTLASGRPPGAFSDHFFTSQELTLEVHESLAGPPLGEKIVLSLPIVEGSRITSDEPKLVSWLTTPGSVAVYFIGGGRIADEDIGVFLGSAENIRGLRALCQGPMPVGVGPVLHTLGAMNDAESAVSAIFATLPPVVLDAFDPEHIAARLTVVKGKVRALTGIRLERILANRGPDLSVHATATQWAEVLTGKCPAAALDCTGKALQLVAALDRVGQVIGDDMRLCRLINAAAP
jgi:hypothetical protein